MREEGVNENDATLSKLQCSCVCCIYIYIYTVCFNCLQENKRSVSNSLLTAVYVLKMNLNEIPVDSFD